MKILRLCYLLLIIMCVGAICMLAMNKGIEAFRVAIIVMLLGLSLDAYTKIK